MSSEGKSDADGSTPRRSLGRHGRRVNAGSERGGTIIWMPGPKELEARKRWAAAKRAEREGRTGSDKAGPVTEETGNYRTAFRDAEGRPFPREGEVRVFLDDDIEDRRAPEGWVHLRTVREVCMLILQERVVELSLDNDLDGDVACGVGYQVIDFLEELHGTEDRPLWPRDGITLHTANPEGRATMKRAIESLPRRLAVEVEDVTAGSKPRYIVRPVEEAES